MHNIFRRTGAQTWSVRFHVPRERREDVGKAFGAKSGHKAEVVRTLNTTDRNEAMGRRALAIEKIRVEIDARLQAIGLPPLHGDWKPEWAFAWAEEDNATAEALEARQEIARASTREDQTEEVYRENPNGSLRLTTMRTSERDRMISDMLNILSDRAETLREAGQNAGPYIDKFKAVALGEITPMGDLLDRWFRDIDGTVKRQTLMGHHLSFRLLGEFLLEREGQPAQDGEAYIRTVAIEALTKRTIAEFPEWLAQVRKLKAKTIQSRISPLSVFWGWAERKGYASGTNPWQGATTGLKRRAEQEDQEDDKETAFAEVDMLRLLRADPNTIRRWKYGPPIHDLLRLALFTGARQNELCSLTRDRVIPPETEGGLWAIRVTSEVAKTLNSLRLIPLHPLVQPIIARRLAQIKPNGKANAPLFPELPPGGPDRKRSWTFSKRFTTFRRAVLGEDDPHTFHNLRGTFMTYFAEAAAKGANACTPLIRDRLVGHVPQALGDNTYVGALGRGSYERAILGMVEMGMPEAVRLAL
ncbi:phage integrase family protein [Komagataeibacter europaeus]|uniref:Phage integrase family protein n=2 Tax=Komagataeibacter europaeus TaxID=33995 RepID=A0A0M0EFA2_KOMEU|nr:tyrosine-type recombinase/integrase [Komagataeibacter europaeus]KON63925.1 phage integrase family protein [Komagataeibacter europaeus]